MSMTSLEAARAGDHRPLLQGAGLATLGGVVWLSAIIFLPNLRAMYETEETALATLQGHRTEVFLGWSMFALGEALVGVGIWMIARQVSRTESGWKSTVAGVAGWAFLVAALTSALIRVWPPLWSASAEDLAEGTSEVWWGILIGAVWVVMSVAFVALAVVLLRSAAWPTWLGVVLIPLGLLPLVLFLPLFYWVGAVLLGVVVLVRTRWSSRPGDAVVSS
jgi:hypothetical protein